MGFWYVHLIAGFRALDSAYALHGAGPSVRIEAIPGPVA